MQQANIQISILDKRRISESYKTGLEENKDLQNGRNEKNRKQNQKYRRITTHLHLTIQT